MGLVAAFLFVAQMINFPVIGGTSGHLLGGVMAAVLLGPSEAVLVMSVVLIAQAFLFADGGVLALGANVFNMGIAAVLGGYFFYRLVAAVVRTEYGKLVGAAFGAWASTVLASICCTGELAWSGTVAWSVGFPAMTGIHMLIGAGEALITALVLTAVYRARPALMSAKDAGAEEPGGRTISGALIYGGLVTLGLALFVLPFASKWPDGLEKVAAAVGFDAKAVGAPLVSSPLAGYRVPVIGSLPAATALAGIVGAVLVFALSFVLAKALHRKSGADAAGPGPGPES
jgi:cobalt/nickel transport system permease protein